VKLIDISCWHVVHYVIIQYPRAVIAQ